jgi:hypothetical protein
MDPVSAACSIDAGRTDGKSVVTISNGRLRVEILPELGGKIWSLHDDVRGTQWIWQNRQAAHGPVGLHSNYDDNWSGGWEELFPNDAPGEFQGKHLPDHGEWWSRPWHWEAVSDTADAVAIRLTHRGVVTPTECEKTISLTADQPRVSVSYRIRNVGLEPLHVLFKQHLPVAIGPHHRIELPGGRVTPVDLAFSRRLGDAGPFEWPVGRDATGAAVDLSELPHPGERLQEFVYVSDLPEGWCGVRDSRTGGGIRLHFPQAVFPYVWLFMTFGGWRDLYTVVLEPCTNMPKDLGAAFTAGCCASIAPSATLEAWAVAEMS